MTPHDKPAPSAPPALCMFPACGCPMRVHCPGGLCDQGKRIVFAPLAPPLDVEAIRARASFVVATGGSSTPRGAETSTGIGLRAEVERLRQDVQQAQAESMAAYAAAVKAERERDEARAEVERLTSALAVERHAANVVAASAMQSQAEHDEEARRLREMESATGSWGLDMQARAEKAERERDEARAEVDNLRADLAAALARERNAVAMVREDTERARGLRSKLDAIPCPRCRGDVTAAHPEARCLACGRSGKHPGVQAALKACEREGLLK